MRCPLALSISLPSPAALPRFDRGDYGVDWESITARCCSPPPDALPLTVSVYDVRDLVSARPNVLGDSDEVDYQYDPLVDLITGAVQAPAWSGEVPTVQDCNPFRGRSPFTRIAARRASLV